MYLQVIVKFPLLKKERNGQLTLCHVIKEKGRVAGTGQV